MKADWILLGAVIAKPDAASGIDAEHIHDPDVRRIIRALQDKNLKDGRAMAVQLAASRPESLSAGGSSAGGPGLKVRAAYPRDGRHSG